MQRTLLRTSALVALIMFLTGAATDEVHAACPGADVATVAVTIDTPSVTYDQALSRAEIFREVRGSAPAGAEDLSVLGVTSTNIVPHANIDYTADPDEEGGWCVHLTKITVPISWMVEVHVAPDLKAGSCMYKAVYEHEQGHVEISREMIPRAKELIENSMVTVVRVTIIAKSVEVGARKLRSAASVALREAIKTIADELESQEDRHDTPEEYDTARKRCGDAEYNRALGG